jgi:hypothetical protein
MPSAADRGPERERESPWLVAPPLVLAVLSLALGLAIPPALDRNLRQAGANVLGVEADAPRPAPAAISTTMPQQRPPNARE